MPLILLALLLAGCAEMSSRSINSHCVETTIGKPDSAHTTTTSDCDYDIRSKSTGF
jgi:hypothetical protein